MRATRSEASFLPPPPGIIRSLRAGFDVITTHIAVILMPLALDLLLWLGPRLSLNDLVQPVLTNMSTLAANSGLKPDDASAAFEMYKQFFKDLNLLAVLRSFPIGVSSLMSGRMPTQSPLGSFAVLQVSSPEFMLGLILLLTLAGWILGGLYFQWVAVVVLPEPSDGTVPSAGRAVLQTLLYSFVWSLLSWTLGLPMLLIVYVLFAINTLLGEGVLLFVGFMSLWLIVPLFFSLHGIFVRRQNALASFVGGFHLTRFTLPTSSLFVLSVFLIGVGLNFLWSVPANDSWLALVGILGHAFVTTALLASSFVYYHDMTAWLETVLARLRAGVPTQQVQ